MEKVYLGHVAVDSGQLMVTDPSYVRDFDNNNFEDDEPDNSYSYNGSGHTTLNEDGGGMLQHNGIYLGVAFSSGYGDGRYPVYGYMNKDQRITKVEILMD